MEDQEEKVVDQKFQQHDNYIRITESITKESQFYKLIGQMKHSTTLEEKLNDVQVLIQTQALILAGFANLPGLKILSEWLIQSIMGPELQEELALKILTVLQRLSYTKTNLDHSKLPQVIQTLKDNDQPLSDEISKKVFVIYMKHKQLFDKWLVEQKNKPQQDEEQSKNQKNFNKWSNKDQVKYFRKSDEPTVPGLTLDEVEIYRNQMIQEQENNQTANNLSSLDYRHKESLMEADQRKQMIEDQKKQREKLDSMTEQIPYTNLLKIKFKDSSHLDSLSKESKEKDLHTKRIQSKLMCFYKRQQDIPNDPTESNLLQEQEQTKEIKIIPTEKFNEEDFLQVIRIALRKGEQQKENKKEGSKVIKGILKRSKQDIQNQEEIRKAEQKKIEEETKKIDQNALSKLFQLLQEKNPNDNEEIKNILKDIGNQETIQHIVKNISLLQQWHQKQEQEKFKKYIRPSGKHNNYQIPNFNFQKKGPPHNFLKNKQMSNNFMPQVILQNNFMDPGLSIQLQNSSQQPQFQPRYPIEQPNQTQPQFNAITIPSSSNQIPLPRQIQPIHNQQLGPESIINHMQQPPPPNSFQNIPISQQFNDNQQFQQQISMQQKNLQQQQQVPQYQQQQPQQEQLKLPNPQQLGINKFNALNQLQNLQKQGPPQIIPPPPPQMQQNIGKPEYQQPFQPSQQNQQQYIQKQTFNNSNDYPQQFQQQQQFQGYQQPHQQQQNQPYYQNQQGYNQNIKNNQYPKKQFQQNNSNNMYHNNNNRNQMQQQQQIQQQMMIEQQQHQQDENIQQGNEGDDKKQVKYKTVPCVFYHSHVGCNHGDSCNFIHDPQYNGRPTPNMHKYVKPAHALSKRPEQNVVNLLLLQKKTSSGESIEQNEVNQNQIQNQENNKFQKVQIQNYVPNQQQQRQYQNKIYMNNQQSNPNDNNNAEQWQYYDQNNLPDQQYN